MERKTETFELATERVPEAFKCTRKQTEYAERLAEKTGSKLPTERQLLDYCTKDRLSYAITLMLRDYKITFK